MNRGTPGELFVLPLPSQGTARPSLPHKPPARGTGWAEGPGPGRSPRSVPRAWGGSGGHDREGAPQAPPPRAPWRHRPAPLTLYRGRGGAPSASRRRPRRPYGAFTFLVGHGAAGGARRPRGSRRGRLSEAGGRFLRSLFRPLRPRLRLLFPAPAACGSRHRAPLRAPTPTNQRPPPGGAGQSAKGKGRGRQRARWSRGRAPSWKPPFSGAPSARS